MPDASAAPPLLELRGLRKRFGGILAVDGVSLSIPHSGATGLIGPNGAGKTTLFNLLSGLDAPDEGSIVFGGQSIQGLPPHRISRLGIGRTFQSVRVFGELSVTDNLRLADLNGRGAGAGNAAQRIADSIEFVGMIDHRHTRADELSYGQRKLVELAMVLIQEPRLILLDEPVAGVNPVLVERIGALLAELVRRGQSLLVVEHNIPFVIGLCPRIVVLANGALLADGSGADIQRDERVLEAFLGGT